MGPAVVRSGVLFFAVALLQACGGDDDDSGLPRPPDPVASLSATEISFTAEPGDAEPVIEIRVLVSNPPVDGFYVRTEYTESAIVHVDYDSGARVVRINFIPPHQLRDGEYTDTVDVQVCRDFDCFEEIEGSPFEVPITYAVSGGRSATLSEDFIERTTDTLNNDRHAATLSLTFDRPADYWYVYEDEISGKGISYVEPMQPVGNVAEVHVQFGWGSDYGPGRHDGTAQLRVCYEHTCMREVGGSPFTISTRLNVHAAPEPGVEALQVQSRTALNHNVIDAQFSAALNAVVMVSDVPARALYVYDVAAGTESQVLLAKKPKAVSIAPDGVTAAVGHDALISIVDLSQVGQPGAPAPARLRVPFDVHDLAMDGRGKVHVMPAYVDLAAGIRTVDVATGTITPSSGRQVYSSGHILLHPSGDFLYSDAFESPSKLIKWDVTSGAAVAIHESPYVGEYENCGDLWINQPGDTIYTACGATFRSAADPVEDLLYSGTLELHEPGIFNWFALSLSQSEAVGEIALVEGEYYTCKFVQEAYPCYTHLVLYESAFLDRQAIYGVSPVAVDGIDYVQVGTFVFHDGAGRKVLLSQLDATQDVDVIHYLSIVN